MKNFGRESDNRISPVEASSGIIVWGDLGSEKTRAGEPIKAFVIVQGGGEGGDRKLDRLERRNLGTAWVIGAAGAGWKQK